MTSNVDRLLEDTVPHLHMRLARKTASRVYSQPPEIAEMRQRLRAAQAGSGLAVAFGRWSRSQVAGYRVELVARYVSVMFFGITAIRAGIPIFQLTTPDPYGWATVAGVAILSGGLIAGIGATRAGEEPARSIVRIFNWVEFVGAAILTLSLGVYAASLLVYGVHYDDLGRQTIGTAMAALATGPAVRMVWLIFRPARSDAGAARAMAKASKGKQGT